MKPTGIIRRIDDLGRIVLPRELRKTIFGKGDVDGLPMEIFYGEDGTVILKPYMNDTVALKKTDIKALIGYIHAVLEIVDTESMEYENAKIVVDGYANFVEPIIKAINNDKEE